MGLKTQPVLIKFVTGDVAIMQFIIEFPNGTQREALDNEISDEIYKSSFEHEVYSWERIDRESIPKDRTFRNAWGHDLKVRMDKARDIHRDRLRIEREPLMLQLDVEFMKNLEAKKDNSQVSENKRKLRDITKHPLIDAATTPEELKELTIDKLI